MYHSAEHMDDFLRSLNYWSYYETSLPRWLAAAAQESGFRAGDRVRLLDVGCGSGELTLIVCTALAKTFDMRLSVVEPSATLLHRSKDLLSKTMSPEVFVSATQRTFQDLCPRTDAHDLILCSHSLYEPLEEAPSAGFSSAAEAVARKLLDMLTPGGAFCVILASKNSWAYEAKRSAYELLGLPADAFSYAERLTAALEETGASLEVRTVDTYADTTMFSCASADDRQRSIRWLSFFLRVNCTLLDPHIQDGLITIIRKSSLPFRCLPEPDRELCASHPAICGGPQENSLLLFHKELAVVGVKN